MRGLIKGGGGDGIEFEWKFIEKENIFLGDFPPEWMKEWVWNMKFWNELEHKFLKWIEKISGLKRITRLRTCDNVEGLELHFVERTCIIKLYLLFLNFSSL